MLTPAANKKWYGRNSNWRTWSRAFKQCNSMP